MYPEIFPDGVAPELPDARPCACARTYLDLGRLEGRDGAGESGGNAGHDTCLVLSKEGCVCGNGDREASAIVLDSKKTNLTRQSLVKRIQNAEFLLAVTANRARKKEQIPSLDTPIFARNPVHWRGC